MPIKIFSLVALTCALSVQAAPSTTKQTLPPLPNGVTELKFGEFFVNPVGPKGLTPTKKLRRLDGKRVRMIGYMVEQDKGVPGVFLFSALPIHLHDHDSALADDLPAAVVHVTVPTCRDQKVPYARGLMLLSGTLSLGPRNEPDGRISFVRLALDPPEGYSAERETVSSQESSHPRVSNPVTQK